jgi:ABC-type amino acid transport substrate-binding protein
MHDITEELARRAKLKVVWSEELQFGNIAQALKSGKIDAVCSGVWEITERGRELQFSEAIALNLAKLFVAASSPIRSYRELLAETDLRMATVDGEISSLIKHYTFPVHNEVSLPKESDGPTMLLQLVTRKADFTLTDTGSAQAFHAAYPGALREVADFPTVHFPIAYVALRGEHQLTNLLNLGVRELRRSGVIDALMHRYDPEQSYFTAK